MVKEIFFFYNKDDKKNEPIGADQECRCSLGFLRPVGGHSQRAAGGARSWETSHLNLELQRKKSEQTWRVHC